MTTNENTATMNYDNWTWDDSQGTAAPAECDCGKTFKTDTPYCPVCCAKTFKWTEEQMTAAKMFKVADPAPAAAAAADPAPEAEEEVEVPMTQGGTCCLCHNHYEGWGHNPYPLCDKEDYDSRCCDRCNAEEVIPTRLREWVHVAAKAKLHAKLKAMGDRRKRR